MSIGIQTICNTKFWDSSEGDGEKDLPDDLLFIR